MNGKNTLLSLVISLPKLSFEPTNQLNTMRIFSLIFAFVFVLSCSEKQSATTISAMEKEIKVVEKDNPNLNLNTIAFGSCSRQDSPQLYWKYVAQQNPDLWIWLGDNIYGDSEDMQVLQAKYTQLKSDSNYQGFTENHALIGIWDDHDYGVNDGGKDFPKKKASRDLMFDFLEVPKTHPAWQRKGGYTAYTFGETGKKVKVILLDARYFRDSLEKSYPEPKTYVYLPNKEGDILGEAQWTWLEEELKNSDAQLHLIGSGIQIIPEDHRFEKWANFPTARKRLFETIAASGQENVVLLSGDRHISEFSQMDIEDKEKPLYEFTSSGLTHTWSGGGGEENQHRVGELTIATSFGAMEIDWDATPLSVTMKMFSTQNGELLQERKVAF